MNVNGAATYNKPGNGAFIHSCHTHCEAQSGSWNSFKIGGVSMQQASRNQFIVFSPRICSRTLMGYSPER